MTTISYTKHLNTRYGSEDIVLNYTVDDDKYVPIDTLMEYINNNKGPELDVSVNKATNIISISKPTFFECSSNEGRIYMINERIPTTYKEADWVIWYTKNHYAAEVYVKSNCAYDKKLIRFCSMNFLIEDDSISLYSEHSDFIKKYNSTDLMLVVGQIKNKFSIVFEDTTNYQSDITFGLINDDVMYCTHRYNRVKLFTYDSKYNILNDGFENIHISNQSNIRSKITNIVSIINRT